jgi:hypothetical protein
MLGKQSGCIRLPESWRDPRRSQRTVARGDGQEAGHVMASLERVRHDHGASRPLSTDLSRGNSGIFKGRCAERPRE